MISRLSEKYKFYLLILLMIVAMMICYQVAFKSTIEIIKQYSELKDMAAVAEDIPEKTAELSRQLDEINSKYFTETKGQQNTHELILEKISSIATAHSVRLIEFPARQIYQKASVEVETHTALMSGSFINLLKVLYYLEINAHTGRIISVGFYSERDRKTKTRNLYTRIYIQNYRNLKDYEN